MRLTIRQEQLNVLEAVAEERLVLRIAAHLRSDYGDANVTLPGEKNYSVSGLDDKTLHGLVRHGIGRARAHGLRLESSVAAFAALMFEVAPNFDQHRLCEVLLADEELEPDARIDEVVRVLTEKNWETIRGEYDPAAWSEEIEEAPAAEAPAEFDYQKDKADTYLGNR